MIYAQPFYRLVVSGTTYDAETWSWGLSLIREGFTSEPLATEVPQAIIDAVSTFHAATYVSSRGAKLDLIKLNSIGTDGRYERSDETVQHEFETPIEGAGTNNPPPQIALAVSLMTAAARGRAHAGRFYLPLPSGSTFTDGRMTASAQGIVLTSVTTMLNAVNLALPDFRVGVTSGIAPGAQRVVTHARLGRVYDTLRSRRTSMDEDYVEGAPLAVP